MNNIGINLAIVGLISISIKYFNSKVFSSQKNTKLKRYLIPEIE